MRLTILTLAASALAACSAAAPTAPARATGEVRGVVVDLAGGQVPIGTNGSEVYLVRAPEDPRATAVRRGPVTGASPRFAFAIDSVPPGRYYVEACLHIGYGRACAPYTRQDGGGAWEPVDVRAGARTEITVRF